MMVKAIYTCYIHTHFSIEIPQEFLEEKRGRNKIEKIKRWAKNENEIKELSR